MNLTCVDKPTKFRNLTLNHQYEAVEDGEVYVVTNDAGFRSRYAKKYFRVVPEAPVNRNLLDLLTVAAENFDDGIGIDITLNRTNRHVTLGISPTEISCGIDEIEGISELKSTINDMYAHKMADIIGTKEDMFRAIMTEILRELHEEENKMCWLLSDAIKTTDTELDAVLTELAEISTTGRNPNSGHDIILWVIK
jgi:hypothetical protein